MLLLSFSAYYIITWFSNNYHVQIIDFLCTLLCQDFVWLCFAQFLQFEYHFFHELIHDLILLKT